MRYWKRVDEKGNITTVESYSHGFDIEGAVEITKKEFEEYIASMPKSPPKPSRDILAEIDELKAKFEQLERRLS